MSHSWYNAGVHVNCKSLNCESNNNCHGVLLSITNLKSNGIGYMIILLIAVSCICNSHFEQFPQFSCHKMNLTINYSNCSVYSAHSPKIIPSILLQLNL